MKLNARILSVLTVLVLATLITLAYMLAGGKRSESHAASIVAECTEQQDRARCYESLVPLLYPEMNVPQLFEIIRSIRSADPSYQFCHVLAHKIGERVVAEDPEKWVSAIPLNPSDGYCSNGFIHGVVGGRFRSEVLDDKTLEKFLPDFTRACEPHDRWNPSDLDKAICYHGMGHLYDFITNAELTKALGLCEKTAPEQFRRVCIEGVFMQIYQPLEPDDYALIEQMNVQPTKNTVRQFCATFKEPEYVGACLRESWPLYEGFTNGTGISDFCSGQPDAEREDRCYQSAFSIVGRLLLSQPDDSAHACDVVPAERRTYCYSVVANTILEEGRSDADDAVAFCERADKDMAHACLTFLMQIAQFNFGSNTGEYTHFCRALPEEYRAHCMKSTSSQ